MILLAFTRNVKPPILYISALYSHAICCLILQAPTVYRKPPSHHLVSQLKKASEQISTVKSREMKSCT